MWKIGLRHCLSSGLGKAFWRWYRDKRTAQRRAEPGTQTNRELGRTGSRPDRERKLTFGRPERRCAKISSGDERGMPSRRAFPCSRTNWWRGSCSERPSSSLSPSFGAIRSPCLELVVTVRRSIASHWTAVRNLRPPSPSPGKWRIGRRVADGCCDPEQTGRDKRANYDITSDNIQLSEPTPPGIGGHSSVVPLAYAFTLRRSFGRFGS